MNEKNVFRDTHCHLNHPKFHDDVDDVTDRAVDAGIERIVDVGTDLETTLRAVALSERRSEILAAGGIHPQEGKKASGPAKAELESLAAGGKLTAIGETGLDYLYDGPSKKEQQDLFAWHLQLASESNLPVIIHDRNAHADVERITFQNRHGIPWIIMHCYSADLKTAWRYVKLGYMLGIGGIISFRNPGALVDVVREIPLEHLILETDSPYLSPVPHRGMRNEPMRIIDIARKVAEIRKTDIAHIAGITTANARRIFEPG